MVPAMCEVSACVCGTCVYTQTHTHETDIPALWSNILSGGTNQTDRQYIQYTSSVSIVVDETTDWFLLLLWVLSDWICWQSSS